MLQICSTKQQLVGLLAVCLAVSATADAIGQTTFALEISSSEALLTAANQAERDLLMHLESWDSPLQRLIERNTPFIEVTNTSATASLTQFRMTIGDTLFNFSDQFLGDFAVLGFSTTGVALTSSVEMGGDELVIDIGNGGLAPGEAVRFRVDIDRDDPASGFLYPDFRSVFYDLTNTPDNTDNSMTTAIFSTGASLSAVLEDQPDTGNTFVNEVRPYAAMEDVELFSIEVVPEPTSGALVLLSLTTLAARRRRAQA